MDAELQQLQRDIESLRMRLAERVARLDRLIEEGRGLLAESAPRLCGASIATDDDWGGVRVRFFDESGRWVDSMDYLTDDRADAVAYSNRVLGVN